MQTRSSRLLVLLIAGLLGGGLALTLSPHLVHAQSPTPITTVKNGSGTVRLQSFYGGGLLAPGSLLEDGTENDSIPAEGEGTRMMWYPEKAAFRAGRVGVLGDGTQWDAAKVGRYSTAFGRDTKASDFAAVAMGANTTASGENATAMGSDTEASGDDATAVGNRTTASGDYATAMGDQTTASGDFATAVGRETTASDFAATVMGDNTTATGQAATAMGRETTASENAATAMGFEATASGDAATAMGIAATAATNNSISLGECNSVNTSPDGTLLAVGNGSYDILDDKCSSRSDALVLDESGNLTINGSLTEGSDRRLKKQIEPFGEGTLQKLADLRPVRFQFKDQRTHPSGEQIGLIAQDVRKEFPQLVTKGSDGMLSLAYPKLTAVLLKGLQEQQSTIDEQQAQLAEKQAQIDSLKEQVKRIDRLEKRLTALERQDSSALPAGWTGPWVFALLLGLGGLAGGLLWQGQT